MIPLAEHVMHPDPNPENLAARYKEALVALNNAQQRNLQYYRQLYDIQFPKGTSKPALVGTVSRGTDSIQSNGLLFILPYSLLGLRP